MPLEVPIIPTNLASAARTAPTPGPKDLTPAIAAMMEAYKKGFIDTVDIQKAGMSLQEAGMEHKEKEDESLEDQHDKEIIRALQGRGALGTPAVLEGAGAGAGYGMGAGFGIP